MIVFISTTLEDILNRNSAIFKVITFGSDSFQWSWVFTVLYPFHFIPFFLFFHSIFCTSLYSYEIDKKLKSALSSQSFNHAQNEDGMEYKSGYVTDKYNTCKRRTSSSSPLSESSSPLSESSFSSVQKRNPEFRNDRSRIHNDCHRGATLDVSRR